MQSEMGGKEEEEGREGGGEEGGEKRGGEEGEKGWERGKKFFLNHGTWKASAT